MGAPSGGWRPVDGVEDGSLSGAGFSIRARTQARADELWLNVELPDGTWSYVVLREGELVAHEHARSKREAFEHAVEAVAEARVG